MDAGRRVGSKKSSGKGCARRQQSVALSGLAELNMGSEEAWQQCAQQAAACCRSSQAGTKLGMN